MPHQQPHIDKLLTDRYYLRDEEGNLLETEPNQMFDRVAAAIAAAEVKYDLIDKWEPEFFALMADNKFLPNTPTLINAGKPQGVYAACNVLEIPDSMEGIFDTLKKAAIISKYGGGLGLYFGDLREEGSIVKSTGQTSSGPISFMQIFDAMCNTVKQGGSRRGAMLAALPVWHPDIEKFIACKDDGSFSNFNISVVITDDFMEACCNNAQFDLISPSTGVGVNRIWALDLWNKIIEHAHKHGDPGLIFIDEANRKHPIEKEIKCYNACGEQPLLNGESCVLGSINLMAYTREIYESHSMIALGKYEFDWDALEKDIPTMVRFLDDIIDASPYPLKEVEEATKASRKIGLGIMGWADCLIKMKIPYDSQEACALAEQLMSFIYAQADKASRELASEKGKFRLWAQCDPVLQRRNATLLTVAPTGTLSRIAGVSSGIEPIFAWKTHHKLVDLEYDETHWAYKEFYHRPDNDFPDYPKYMKTANEIAPEWHLKMQAAFQKHVDSSISKTINLPNDADVETVEKIYMWAWKNKLKGITIYRDKCKEDQPLNKIEEHKDNEKVLTEAGRHLAKDYNTFIEKVAVETFNKPEYRKRGPVTVGVTHKVDTGRGKIYATINYSEYHSEPVETFLRLGHLSTPMEATLAEWAGRLISLLLKHNVPLEEIMRQGNKVYSDTIFWYNRESFCSFPKLISHLLGYTFEEALDMAELDFDSFMEDGNEHYEENEDINTDNITEDCDTVGEHCYECGAEHGIIGEGGCKVCVNCGFEKCG